MPGVYSFLDLQYGVFCLDCAQVEQVNLEVHFRLLWKTFYGTTGGHVYELLKVLYMHGKVRVGIVS